MAVIDRIDEGLLYHSKLGGRSLGAYAAEHLVILLFDRFLTPRLR